MKKAILSVLFVFSGCSPAPKEHHQYSEPTPKWRMCELWISYYSVCIGRISASQSFEELRRSSSEAIEVRKALARDLYQWWGTEELTRDHLTRFNSELKNMESQEKQAYISVLQKLGEPIVEKYISAVKRHSYPIAQR